MTQVASSHGLAWQAGRLYAKMTWWQRCLAAFFAVYALYEIFSVDPETLAIRQAAQAQYAQQQTIAAQEKAKADAVFRDQSNALYLCQTTMRSLAKDPEKAEIPYVDVFDGGDVWLVAWGASTKMLRMRNGLGLEVAASGSCDVNKANLKLVSLTFDGKQILSANK